MAEKNEYLRTDDSRIRTLAVYTILKNADKAMGLDEIRRIIKEKYNIDACRKAVMYDCHVIELFDDIRYSYKRGERGYKIFKTPSIKVGDVVYIVCNVDNKIVIEEASVEEVSTKRIWTDEVDYDLEEIGKTVFLSREEAEKSLAERNGKE